MTQRWHPHSLSYLEHSKQLNPFLLTLMILHGHWGNIEIKSTEVARVERGPVVDHPSKISPLAKKTLFPQHSLSLISCLLYHQNFELKKKHLKAFRCRANSYGKLMGGFWFTGLLFSNSSLSFSWIRILSAWNAGTGRIIPNSYRFAGHCAIMLEIDSLVFLWNNFHRPTVS